MKSSWHRIKGKCPICEHTGYCTRTSDGMVIKCMHAANEKPLKQKDGSIGYLYKATERGGPLRPLPDVPIKTRRTLSEWKNIVKQHQSAVNPKRLQSLAERLNLSVRSLRLYGVGVDVGGYDGKNGTGWWSFPMYDGEAKVCGMRLRGDDGKKAAITGSQNGLFIPTNYEASAIVEGVCSDEAPLLIVLPEGPTSAAACADMGFRAIGRPNNQLGGEMIANLLSLGSPQDVVIVADDEGTKYTNGIPYWPGWEGALRVAGQIHSFAHRVRVCRLKDAEGKRIKDPRDWLAGKHPLELMASIIDSAEPVSGKWIEEKNKEVLLWRKRLNKSV
jgi:hypothetical protein